MNRQRLNEGAEGSEFEVLEARLLLDASALIQPDGPMPQMAGTDYTPAQEAEPFDGYAKGDGSTTAHLEDTDGTDTLDLRGPANGPESDELYRPESKDIDTLSPAVGDEMPFKGPYVVDLLSTEVDVLGRNAARDGVITRFERRALASSAAPASADEPAGLSGAQAFLRGRVVDVTGSNAYGYWTVTVVDSVRPAGEQDVVLFILFSGGSPDGSVSTVIGGREHRPFIVGYFEDWHYSAAQEPVLPRESTCVCPYNLVAEVVGLSPGAEVDAGDACVAR